MIFKFFKWHARCISFNMQTIRIERDSPRAKGETNVHFLCFFVSFGFFWSAKTMKRYQSKRKYCRIFRSSPCRSSNLRQCSVGVGIRTTNLFNRRRIRRLRKAKNILHHVFALKTSSNVENQSLGAKKLLSTNTSQEYPLIRSIFLQKHVRTKKKSNMC